MHTITYVSTANADLREEDINDLLEASKKANNSNGIKGIFMYAKGNFFQILEGEKEKISTLFQKIQKDKRHYNVIKILDKNVETPSFSNYRSSFVIIQNQENLLELHKYLKRAKEYNPEGFKSISYITKKFITLI